MKITGVEFRRFSAKHHNASRNWLIVKVLTDDPAVYGLGDASAMENDPEVMAIIEGWFTKYLNGADPLDSEVLWTALFHDTQARSGRLATTALSGVDIALWDIKGRVLGQPVYKLLGGAHRKRIRVYANGWYTNPGTPQQNGDEAKRVVDMGYTAMKFDPFGQENYYTISLAEAQLAQDRVAAVRQSVGPNVDILVEAHAKFNVATAIQLGKRLEEYLPLFYEEPVSPENISELAEVRERVDIPIATGEKLYTKFPFMQILEQRAADVLQPDIANAGGITELKKIAIMAEARHVTMAPHNVCSPVGALAEMHLDASVFNFLIQEYHAEFYTGHYFTVMDGFPRQKDGYIELSDAPGLGLTLNDDEIAAHPPLEKVNARGGTVRGI
ncbi:MAG: mandelate racemase/muconate lactonizing enzyme family protein [Dehalococcoidia bacterium]